MRTNVATRAPRTHEGAVASIGLSPEQQLRRSVMCCLLWEDTFYESGVEIAERICDLVAKCDKSIVAQLAVEARSDMKLRHVPLLLCRELARYGALRKKILAEVVQRPDELCEFLSLYWQDGKCKLAASVKRGLAQAFTKFDAYQLAKWNQDRAVKLRDVLFLCHAKPVDDAQAAVWKQLVDKTLAPPDTWEVALSSGADKRSTWERLLAENKLGAMALLRNLRNIKAAGVPDDTVKVALARIKAERVLPFRFVGAAKHAPHLEPELESAMFRCLESVAKLSGKTAIVVDNSGSMYSTPVSAKSDLERIDAACALAMLVREVCERCVVIGFGNSAAVIPARRGFALRDAIKAGPGGGTHTERACQLARQEGYDRIILITDEQSHEEISPPEGRGYLVNVANYQNGIGYRAWTHIDGWSESVLNYVSVVESDDLDLTNGGTVSDSL